MTKEFHLVGSESPQGQFNPALSRLSNTVISPRVGKKNLGVSWMPVPCLYRVSPLKLTLSCFPLCSEQLVGFTVLNNQEGTQEKGRTLIASLALQAWEEHMTGGFPSEEKDGGKRNLIPWSPFGGQVLCCHIAYHIVTITCTPYKEKRQVSSYRLLYETG